MTFRDKGLRIALKTGNRHSIISGHSLDISLYATSGKVNAAPISGMSSVNIKGMLPERDIERVAVFSKFGCQQNNLKT